MLGRANEPEIAVDPIILGELRFGILILPKGGKRRTLERWFGAGIAQPGKPCRSRTASSQQRPRFTV
jgi:hypothetical protein